MRELNDTEIFTSQVLNFSYYQMYQLPGQGNKIPLFVSLIDWVFLALLKLIFLEIMYIDKRKIIIYFNISKN